MTKANIPNNYYFWCWTLKNAKEREEFIKKGNKNQHKTIKSVLKYMKNKDIEIFEEINGDEILKKLIGR